MTQEVLPPTHRYETRCRLCFSDEAERSCSLFPDARHPTSDDHPVRAAELIEMILECTSIQITLEEDYPAKVCEKCVETLDKFYQYRRRCLLNDQILRTERQAAAVIDRKNDGSTDRTGHRPPSSSSQHHRSSSPSPLVPAIRVKREPSPLLDRLDEGAVDPPQHEERTESSLADQHVPRIQQQQQQQLNAAENDAPSEGGGTSSILRSILLQTRDSTTSRSSPNTEPESPRQTPQPPAAVAPGASPVPIGAFEETKPQSQHAPTEEQDVKPSLLQQMLLQQTSPARSPTKVGPSGCLGSGAGADGVSNVPSAGGTTTGGGSLTGASASSSSGSSSSSSSLLKRMLLDGSGTSAPSNTSGELLLAASPREGSSQQQARTKHEPLSATGTPSPPCAPEDEVPSTETPLASQLRSILLQHRAAAMVRSESMSSVHTQQHDAKQDTVPSIFEKPEVSYIRSLFLRNDSDSDGEPPSTEDQRELLLYTMFQELRTRQQEQQQQQQQHHHHHQQAHHVGGFSSDSDDSDDLPQDYRLPSVRRRSTESMDSRSSKRRRMEYPCLLCGRSFAGRTKLIMHMRTHMMPPASSASSPLAGPPPATAAGSLLPQSLANGGHGGPTAGNSDLEDTASPSPLAAAVAAAASAVVRGGSYNHSSPCMVNNPSADGGGGSLVGTTGNEDEIDALERRSYACYICGADQNNLHQLKEHLLSAHQDRIRSRGRTRERQRASIGCEICHRQFRSQFAYGEHMRTHTGERPFPCDQCDKRFPRRFQLLGHLFNVHKQSWVADESKAKFAKK